MKGPPYQRKRPRSTLFLRNLTHCAVGPKVRSRNHKHPLKIAGFQAPARVPPHVCWWYTISPKNGVADQPCRRSTASGASPEVELSAVPVSSTSQSCGPRFWRATSSIGDVSYEPSGSAYRKWERDVSLGS